MPIAAAAAAVVVVAVIAAVSAQDPVDQIRDALQAAYVRDPQAWAQLPPYAALAPVPGSSAAALDQAVLAGVFVDLLMNRLRAGTCPPRLARFVASLPAYAGPDLRVDPLPQTAEPSPQHPTPPLPGLFEVFGSLLQARPARPAPSPFYVSRCVLNVFGAGLRSALYGAGALRAAQAVDFVAAYVRFMGRSGIPSMTALAVLARDLCLAVPSAQPDDDVRQVCDLLQRRYPIAGLALDLSNAIDLIGGGVGGKPNAAGVPEMAPRLVVDLLVAGLEAGNQALEELCERDAALFRDRVGSRQAAILQSVAFLMIAADRDDDAMAAGLAALLPALCRTPAEAMRPLAVLALFADRHRVVIERARPIVAGMGQVATAISDTLDGLRDGRFCRAPAVQAPALYAAGLVRERLLSQGRLDGAEWPDCFLIASGSSP